MSGSSGEVSASGEGSSFVSVYGAKEDALAPDAQRTDPAEIAAFLDQFNLGAPGAAPMAFAPLGASVQTTSSATSATPTDADRIDAVWCDSSQDDQTDDWLARDRSRQMWLYLALACDALQTTSKPSREHRPDTDEVDLLMLQGD